MTSIVIDRFVTPWPVTGRQNEPSLDLSNRGSAHLMAGHESTPWLTLVNCHFKKDKQKRITRTRLLPSRGTLISSNQLIRSFCETCQLKIADIRNMPLYVSKNGCYYCSSLHDLRIIQVSGKGFQDGWEYVPEVRILIFVVVVIQ